MRVGCTTGGVFPRQADCTTGPFSYVWVYDGFPRESGCMTGFLDGGWLGARDPSQGANAVGMARRTRKFATEFVLIYTALGPDRDNSIGNCRIVTKKGASGISG